MIPQVESWKGNRQTKSDLKGELSGFQEETSDRGQGNRLKDACVQIFPLGIKILEMKSTLDSLRGLTREVLLHFTLDQKREALKESPSQTHQNQKCGGVWQREEPSPPWLSNVMDGFRPLQSRLSIASPNQPTQEGAVAGAKRPLCLRSAQ